MWYVWNRFCHHLTFWLLDVASWNSFLSSSYMWIKYFNTTIYILMVLLFLVPDPLYPFPPLWLSLPLFLSPPFSLSLLLCLFCFWTSTLTLCQQYSLTFTYFQQKFEILLTLEVKSLQTNGSNSELSSVLLIYFFTNSRLAELLYHHSMFKIWKDYPVSHNFIIIRVIFHIIS